jgi:hypothetical protein
VLQMLDARLQSIKGFYSSRCDLAFTDAANPPLSCKTCRNLLSLDVHPKLPCREVPQQERINSCVFLLLK